MAVTLEYQAWTSSTYNWLDRTTATSAPVQIDAKLRAWITAVNANPSNASRQITIEKGLSDGTGNFCGWTIKVGGTAAATTYIGFFTNTASAAFIAVYQTWVTGAANGGYGTFSGSTVGSTSNSFTTSANAAEFIVSTETADAEEFFCLGYKTNASSGQTGAGVLLIFKDTAGEWSVVLENSGSTFNTYHMPTHTTPQRQYGATYVPFSASQNVSIDPLCLRATGTGFFPAANNLFTTCSIAKSPHLYATTNTSIAYQFGRYAVLANGRTAICPGYTAIFVSYV